LLASSTWLARCLAPLRQFLNHQITLAFQVGILAATGVVLLLIVAPTRWVCAVSKLVGPFALIRRIAGRPVELVIPLQVIGAPLS